MCIIKDVTAWCNENDAKLIYLVKFGSHLYGTDSTKSDTDYKGLYLPNKASQSLKYYKKSLVYSTGNEDKKNTKADIDLQLMSLQNFFNLLSIGDIGALDLLYAHTYPEMILYADPKMHDIFKNHQHLFSIKKCKSYLGYSINQARKYGIEGSRAGALKNVVKVLNTIPKERDNEKINKLLIKIVNNNQITKHLFSKTDINGIFSLVLGSKVYQSTIKVKEFKQRVFNDYAKYKERVEEAEKSEGVDWKALSHAIRALNQMISLINTGKINYPLIEASMLKHIKNGNLTYPEVEALILDKIEEVKILLVNLKKELNVKNNNIIEKLTLAFYT